MCAVLMFSSNQTALGPLPRGELQLQIALGKRMPTVKILKSATTVTRQTM